MPFNFLHRLMREIRHDHSGDLRHGGSLYVGPYDLINSCILPRNCPAFLLDLKLRLLESVETVNDDEFCPLGESKMRGNVAFLHRESVSDSELPPTANLKSS